MMADIEDRKNTIRQLEIRKAELEAQPPLFAEFASTHEDEKLHVERRLRNQQRLLAKQEQSS